MLDKQKVITKSFLSMWELGVAPWKRHELPLLEEYKRRLKRRFGKPRILDWGCGDGWVSLKLARDGIEVTGVDASEVAIRQANEQAETLGLSEKTTYEVRDGLDLPFDPESFEGVVDRGFFHHILPGNRNRYFDILRRVLRVGGAMYLSLFTKRNPAGIGQRFDREEFDDLFGEWFETVEEVEDEYQTRSPAHLITFILERKGAETT